MAKIIHVMIRVLHEQRSLDFYATALDLTAAARYPFAAFTLIYLRNAENDFELELTVNHDRTEPYNHGDGYGHVAIVVDDLDARHAHLTGAGIVPTPIKELSRDGVQLARFFFITDPDGYKIEVLQRYGRYR